MNINKNKSFEPVRRFIGYLSYFYSNHLKEIYEFDVCEYIRL